MNTPNETKRDFIISEESLLQDSRTTLAEFVSDATTFKNFDADFDINFATRWQTAIDDAYNAPTDEQILDVQTGLTADVDEKMEACRQHFQAAKYFIEKAFPNKASVWNEFGFDNYETARKSAEKMILFMGVFASVAAKPAYQPLLISAGYTQANIDAIDTKRKELVDAKTAQEMAKNGRGTNTQTRTELLNKVWDFRSRVSKAAKNIFVDNYARYKVYLLPASAESSNIFSITGTVTQSGTENPLQNVQVTITNTGQATNTDSNGKYGIAKLTNGNYEFSFTLAGYKPFNAKVEFSGQTIQLNVSLVKE